MTTIPALSRDTSAEVRRAIDALAKYLKEVEQAASTVQGGGTTIIQGGNTTIINQGGSNLTIQPPTQPTGLKATGAYEYIILSWNPPEYRGHSHTIVYRAQTNNFGAAVQIGTVGGSMYLDAPPRDSMGQTYYYWIRFVNLAGVEGNINAAQGTAGSTATDPALLLQLLANRLGYEHFDVANGVFPVRVWTGASLPVLPNATTWPAGSVIYATQQDKLYRTKDGQTWTSSVSASDLSGTISQAQFAAGLEPLAIVSVLPNPVGYTGPKIVLLETNGKLYRYTGGAWTASVSAADMAGQVAYYQIAANAILADKILAGEIRGEHLEAEAIEAGHIKGGAIIADHIAANEIITNSAQIKNGIITNAKIGSVAADKITAGIITAPLVVVGSTLKSADEAFTIDAQEKYLQITGSDNSKSVLTAGDLYFLTSNGDAYKSVRRIVVGEGEYGLYVPFNPPFYTMPTVMVFLKEAMIYDSTGATTSQFLEVDAVNVTRDGFTLVLAHRKGGAPVITNVGHVFSKFAYNGTTFVSTTRTTGADTHVADVVITGSETYQILQSNLYYFKRYEVSHAMFKVGYRIAGSTGPFTETPMYQGGVGRKIRLINSATPNNFEIQVKYYGNTPIYVGSYEMIGETRIYQPTWVNTHKIDSLITSGSGVGSFIAIEGGV